MTEEFDFSESMTLLYAPRRKLVKTITAAGDIYDYDDAKTFTIWSERIACLDDVKAILTRIMPVHNVCTVRGELIAGTRIHNARRLIYPDKESGDQPTLRDVPRRLLALDCDNVPLPPGTDPNDLLACADVVIDLLPKAFGHARCLVQASASHGIKPGIRLRTWHWCDRPMGTAELKRWLGKLTDASVLNPCQPVYTSNPIFQAPRTDHLTRRLADWPGDEWLRCPTEEELAPPPRPAPTTIRPAYVTGSARARLYVEAALASAHNRIAGAEQRHPVILQEACALARFVHAGHLTRSDLHARLWAAAQQAGKDDEAEIGRMVAFGMDHASDQPMPEGLAHG